MELCECGHAKCFHEYWPTKEVYGKCAKKFGFCGCVTFVKDKDREK